MKTINFDRKLRRKMRVSKSIFGTNEIPRLSVYRSNRYIYAQAIDDAKKHSLASYSSLLLAKDRAAKKAKKTEVAKQVGLKLAQILKEKKIQKAVFDRSRYSYQGRVKAVAEGLREGGIQM